MRLVTCTQANVTADQGLEAELVTCVRRDTGEIPEIPLRDVKPATATQVEWIPTIPSVTLRLDSVSV